MYPEREEGRRIYEQARFREQQPFVDPHEMAEVRFVVRLIHARAGEEGGRALRKLNRGRNHLPGEGLIAEGRRKRAEVRLQHHREDLCEALRACASRIGRQVAG